MMDLTVEIEGDIGTLEQALHRFTENETLDGENKYHCGRLVMLVSFISSQKQCCLHNFLSKVILVVSVLGDKCVLLGRVFLFCKM